MDDQKKEISDSLNEKESIVTLADIFQWILFLLVLWGGFQIFVGAKDWARGIYREFRSSASNIVPKIQSTPTNTPAPSIAPTPQRFKFSTPLRDQELRSSVSSQKLRAPREDELTIGGIPEFKKPTVQENISLLERIRKWFTRTTPVAEQRVKSGFSEAHQELKEQWKGVTETAEQAEQGTRELLQKGDQLVVDTAKKIDELPKEVAKEIVNQYRQESQPTRGRGRGQRDTSR